MIAILTALLLTIATHAEATCDKLCDRDWWKTATAAHLNRPGFTGDCLVLLKRLLDLSRNCAASFIAYYALKENTDGKQTNSRA